MLVLVEVLNGGFRALKRKRVRSRVVGVEKEVTADDKPEDSPPE